LLKMGTLGYKITPLISGVPKIVPSGKSDNQWLEPYAVKDVLLLQDI